MIATFQVHPGENHFMLDVDMLLWGFGIELDSTPDCLNQVGHVRIYSPTIDPAKPLLEGWAQTMYPSWFDTLGPYAIGNELVFHLKSPVTGRISLAVTPISAPEAVGAAG